MQLIVLGLLSLAGVAQSRMVRPQTPGERNLEEAYGAKVQKDSFCSTPVTKGKVEFPDSLVGRAQINFDMYSGYVNISSSPDYLFYWFFSSQDGKADAPLIIWTNGSYTLICGRSGFSSYLFIIHVRWSGMYGDGGSDHRERPSGIV
jgi:carboxypeptidase C (cathepsin A)